jgi:hypothetical protein
MPQPLESRYPQPIRELWASLYADVVWLHGRWIIYRQLFGTNEARVKLLNETAGTVAWMLQQSLLHDVQISLSKLGDPAGSGSRTNLTLHTLVATLETAGETELAAKVTPLLDAFDGSCEKVRHRRNKWIAHSDLATKLSSRATPLSGPSREEIEAALLALRNVMNAVEVHYTESQTAYEHFVMNQDGEHLISALARAKCYRELVTEGAIPRDDFRERFPSGV